MQVLFEIYVQFFIVDSSVKCWRLPVQFNALHFYLLFLEWKWREILYPTVSMPGHGEGTRGEHNGWDFGVSGEASCAWAFAEGCWPRALPGYTGWPHQVASVVSEVLGAVWCIVPGHLAAQRWGHRLQGQFFGQWVLYCLGSSVYEVGHRDRTICVPGRRSDTLGLTCGPVALPKIWDQPNMNENSCQDGPRAQPSLPPQMPDAWLVLSPPVWPLSGGLWLCSSVGHIPKCGNVFAEHTFKLALGKKRGLQRPLTVVGLVSRTPSPSTTWVLERQPAAFLGRLRHRVSTVENTFWKLWVWRNNNSESKQRSMGNLILQESIKHRKQREKCNGKGTKHLLS